MFNEIVTLHCMIIYKLFFLHQATLEFLVVQISSSKFQSDHILILPLPFPLIKYSLLFFVSWKLKSDRTLLLIPERVDTKVLLVKFQSLMVLSELPLARKLFSLDRKKANDITLFVCPSKVYWSFYVTLSHVSIY